MADEKTKTIKIDLLDHDAPYWLDPIVRNSAAFNAERHKRHMAYISQKYGKPQKKVNKAMPMSPKAGESKNDFMSRCVSEMKDSNPDWESDRCVAACSSMYESKSNNGKNAKQFDDLDPLDYDDYTAFMDDCMFRFGDAFKCQDLWELMRTTKEDGLVRKEHSGVPRIDKHGVRFIMSDESVDRLGDIIIAEGWQLDNFKKNPIALFNHNPDFAIGKWEDLRVEGPSLRGTLRFAPAGTSDRVDEIRKLVEAGILQTVSVGFRPRATPEPRSKDAWGGSTYRKNELVECSLCTVPANPNAIAVAKNLGISPRTSALVFGGKARMKTKALTSGSNGEQARTKHADNRKTSMTTLTKRIEDSQQRLVGLRDQLVEHLKAVDDENVTDEQLTLTEELNRKIAEQEKGLAALKDSEARLAGMTALTVGSNGNGGTEVIRAEVIGGGKRPFGLAPKKLDGLEYLVRSGVITYFSHTRKEPIDMVREKIYGNDERTKAFIDLTTKAASAPAMTTVTGWAAELVQQVNAEFMATLQPESIYPRLSALGLSLTFGRNGRIILPTRSATPTIAGSFVGEGLPIPVRQGQFTSETLVPKKMAVITTWTREIDEHSVPAIEGLLRSAIQEDTAVSLDSILLDTNAATVIRPAGLRSYGAGLVPTAGGGFNALVGDIKALSGAILTATVGNVRRMVWLMNPQQVLSISLTPAPSAIGVFPFAAEIAAGNLRGFPIIASGTVPLGTVIVLDAADFVSVSGDTPRFEISDQATLHMEDTTPLAISEPGTPPTVAAPIRSLFQTDSLALRLIMPVNWAIRRTPRPIAWVAGVTW